MPDALLQFSLPSTHESLEDAVEKMQAFLEGLELSESLAYIVTLLASEAITNGMAHGNKWEAIRTVDVRIEATDAAIECCVSDQGDGFRLDNIDNPLDPDNLLQSSGRGLYFMRTMADEFHTENSGSRIRLRFNRPGS